MQLVYHYDGYRKPDHRRTFPCSISPTCIGECTWFALRQTETCRFRYWCMENSPPEFFFPESNVISATAVDNFAIYIIRMQTGNSKNIVINYSCTTQGKKLCIVCIVI